MVEQASTAAEQTRARIRLQMLKVRYKASFCPLVAFFPLILCLLDVIGCGVLMGEQLVDRQKRLRLVMAEEVRKYQQELAGQRYSHARRQTKVEVKARQDAEHRLRAIHNLFLSVVEDNAKKYVLCCLLTAMSHV